ncbi:MAG: hypothetical protein QOH63_759 [Acidobacteriota bacterium]|jgi:hypothetical protein|nr:hypothetical protein [Acidobacteriota bacterium]
MGSPPTQLSTLIEEKDAASSPIGHEKSIGSEGNLRARELQMWIRALRSFFTLSNHPLPDAYRSDLITHDWTYELRTVRGILLRCSQLAFHLIHLEKFDQTIFEEANADISLDEFSIPNQEAVAKAELKDGSLHSLAATLSDACALCESILESHPVNLHAWTNLGETLESALARPDASKTISQIASATPTNNIPAPLLSLTRESIKPAAFGADMLSIFSRIFELLEELQYVEKFLRRDQSLKQTLPIFTLVHEEARSLLNFIKTRVLRAEGIEQSVLEALDSTNYAITMELRKVFAHELVGLSSLRQAPAIYIKVETSHGLLSNCFRQSVIGLAQLFNKAIEGSQLFDAFQTRLEQSLVLRRDLWKLLQFVRRAEKEPDLDLIQRLLKNLNSFYEGSLRYLMFKDWETCERFMEEIGAARGAAELAPELHRFTAYLEALSNQVGMRAVLSNHPFDYPEPEDD